MSNHIVLKSIGDLFGMTFYIPDYQRGYRWTGQEVGDLLDDILEFIGNSDVSDNDIYCIQPLVVKKTYVDNDALMSRIRRAGSIEDASEIIGEADIRWEVIDGQQRLTTIHIILSYLGGKSPYSIEYQTRKDSRNHLEDIGRNIGANADNIDYFHMDNAYEIIKGWFEKNNDNEAIFRQVLEEKVQFIWYETDEQNPIKVFTRLNIGKIGLTDSELIKALFLNSSNFKTGGQSLISLQQIEIASEWDRIEYTLQNDEFWLFIHDTGYRNPTRIDFIFDMIREHEAFGRIEKIGIDEHMTFRYFYGYFNKNHKEIDSLWLRSCWREVKDYFQIMEEWYNDIYLYHYIGYLILIEGRKNLKELIAEYRREGNDKDAFKNHVKELIKDSIKDCSDLTSQYETARSEGGKHPPKTVVRKLLILHNIQTVINQNKELVKSSVYKLPAAYKFPFHLFKKEAEKGGRYGWEIEHIASNSGDSMDAKNMEMYLESVHYSCSSEIQKAIEEFRGKEDRDKDFEKLKQQIKNHLNESEWTEEDKNKLWNFTLLDSGTNQEYQNSVFPFKRICVSSKERGRKTECRMIDGKAVTNEIVGIAFVPPCTRSVFSKIYSKHPNTLSSWTHEDARDYLMNINEVLADKDCMFITDQKEKIEEIYIRATKADGGRNNE